MIHFFYTLLLTHSSSIHLDSPIRGLSFRPIPMVGALMLKRCKTSLGAPDITGTTLTLPTLPTFSNTYYPR